MRYPPLTAVAILAMIAPIAALANVTGTQILANNTAFSFDTGATVPLSSGGDAVWSGGSLSFSGKALEYNLGPLGAAAYSTLTQSSLSVFGPLYSTTALSSATLVVNDVFAVKTNGGNYAVALVTANSGGSLAFQFTTFGASSTPSGPAITAVLNNFSFTPSGFPNSGIAPGSLFVIIGSGLADPAAQAVLQSSSGGGLPTILNGSSVKVTVNGTTVVPPFYYATATALALVLPSGTPVGSGQVTVTYNGQTSPAYSVPVAVSAMGFDTYYGTGTGLGVATNPFTGALYSYNNAIPPGSTVTLWGSGLGADAARDSKYVPAAFPINNLAHVYIGGADAPILYQGASGFPGVNQVNVTIPASTPTGCNIALVGVTADGSPTNTVTFPIGTGACSDASTGNSGTVLQTLSGKANVKIGTLLINHGTSQSPVGGAAIASDIATASFQSFGGSAFGASTSTVSGGCIVTQSLSGVTGTLTLAGLDAGTVTAVAAGSSVPLAKTPGVAGVYFAQLPASFINSNTFSIKGGPGADVGAFNVSLDYPFQFNWTNQAAAATVTRSGSLGLTWTGGTSNTYVQITGASSSTDGKSLGSFICMAPQGASQFSVPAYVLSALPAGTGTLLVNALNYTPFTASGIDIGLGLGEISYSVNSTFK